MNYSAIQSSRLRTHVIKTQNSSFKNYCFIVEDIETKEAILIDPAWELDAIDHKLKQYDLTVKAVLLTHHHFDHVHLADKCANVYNISVWMSSDEIKFYGFTCTNLQPLPDKKQMTIGAITIQIITTPGHTYGSVCYLIDSHLFTGDTLFIEGCGICLGKGACPKRMFHSMQKIRTILTDNTLIYPGHRFHLPIGQSFNFVKEHNIYLHLDTEVSFVKFRMRKQGKESWLRFK